MIDTPNLGLPLLASAQAQKHVTHNDALALLDTLVQLSVLSTNQNTPPATPQEGLRILVGSAPGGVFVGHAKKVAVFDAGAWRFLDPKPGWIAYGQTEAKLTVFDGTAWNETGLTSGSTNTFTALGVGTAADPGNPLIAKLNTALFTAKTASESGSGDLRFVLNKEGAANTVSQLYQNGYSGRAETGLTGDDDYCVKVSADGAAWRSALRIDRSTGIVSFPFGAAVGGGFRNLLLNANFQVNQRGFAGGALAAGVYGFDRWKAGTSGCTLNRASDGTLTLNGTVGQVIEAPGLAGVTVTLSVEAPSAAVSVSVAGVTGTIDAGTGRRGVTLSVPAGTTGDVGVLLSTAATTTFARPSLVMGSYALETDRLPFATELLLCQRYFTKTFDPAQTPAANTGTAGALSVMSAGASAQNVAASWRFPVSMRVAPTIVLFNPGAVSSGFLTSAGATVGASATAVSLSGCVVLNSATTVHPSLHSIHATADAEL